MAETAGVERAVVVAKRAATAGLRPGAAVTAAPRGRVRGSCRAKGRILPTVSLGVRSTQRTDRPNKLARSLSMCGQGQVVPTVVAGPEEKPALLPARAARRTPMAAASSRWGKRYAGTGVAWTQTAGSPRFACATVRNSRACVRQRPASRMQIAPSKVSCVWERVTQIRARDCRTFPSAVANPARPLRVRWIQR